jgi:hypothetical protein
MILVTFLTLMIKQDFINAKYLEGDYKAHGSRGLDSKLCSATANR